MKSESRIDVKSRKWMTKINPNREGDKKARDLLALSLRFHAHLSTDVQQIVSN